MGELINGRTPEEIKRWVDGRATCNTCPKEHEVGCEDGERTEDCQMTIDTIAYIERLESERDAALAKVPKWISVKERLPKYVEVALVYAYRYSGGIAEPEGRIYIAKFIPSNRSWMELPDGFAVTHWMPLPSVEGLK